jgi:hypothetical protein
MVRGSGAPRPAHPGFLAENDELVAFLHLDADLYSSTKTVLELVGPRLVAGSVVLFDEYFNYPGWQHGEHRAWHEYVRENRLDVPLRRLHLQPRATDRRGGGLTRAARSVVFWNGSGRMGRMTVLGALRNERTR